MKSKGRELIRELTHGRPSTLRILEFAKSKVDL